MNSSLRSQTDSHQTVASPESKSNASSSADTRDAITPRGILLQTLGALLVLGIVLALISTFLKEPVEAWSKSFIGSTGAWGVGLGFFFPDAFTLPIPPDTFLLAGHLGGLPFWEIAVSASIGSITGGTLGFIMIKRISDQPRARRWIHKKLSSGKLLMDQYGVLALALGALTPLPYSVICWACGAMGMSLRVFFAVSLLRIPRVIGYLWFIEVTYSVT
jgi:membrane protein YqaA with SNARE-associated domain